MSTPLHLCFGLLVSPPELANVVLVLSSDMAVTGLPEPQAKHALNMVRFAWDCLQGANEVVQELECTLGPDTSELMIRIGKNKSFPQPLPMTLTNPNKLAPTFF